MYHLVGDEGPIGRFHSTWEIWRRVDCLKRPLELGPLSLAVSPEFWVDAVLYEGCEIRNHVRVVDLACKLWLIKRLYKK